MRKLCISLFSFLSVCSLLFLSLVCVEASNISQESSSYHNYLKGLLLDEVGEYEQAKKAYQKAAKSDSESWDIHYRLGLDYIRLQDFRRAEGELISVLKIRPHEEKVRFLLARVYSYNSKYDEAINEHLKLLKRPLLELNETDIRYSLVQLYIKQKALDKAEVECKVIIENNSKDSRAHFCLGYIYSESSKTDTAINEFSRAIELNPNNSHALNSLSYLYAELGENLDYALSLIQKALEFEPSNGSYLDTVGWVYFKKGDLENALRYLENASVLVEDAEVFEHLGDVYLKIGKLDEARKNWKKSLKIEPKREQVKNKIKELKKKR